MENGNQPTPPTPAAGAPDGNQPPAVNQEPNAAGAATDETITLPKKDYENLLKQRDANGRKAGDSSRQAQEAAEQLAQTDAVVNALVQKDAVRDAMADPEFKEKYPDVTEAELLDMNPLSDDQIEAFAKNRQERYEQVKQSALKSVQKAEAPTISPQDKATKLKELKKPATVSRFGQALQTLRMPTK